MGIAKIFRPANSITQHDYEKAKFFDCDDTRLNHFFSDETSFIMPAELQYFVKLILILSQGQASVERGFDVNKAVLNVNMN